MSVSRLEEAYALCESELREHDRDRWLASLFAPSDKRRYLHALYTFSFEIARVRDLVSEPRLGEIRLQWWRDVLAGEARGDVGGHPVALAMLDCVERFRLPRPAFLALIDARVFDLYNDPMPSLNDLEGYCGETSSALMRLASLILNEGEEPGAADAVGHAGVAYAITGLLRALPWHAARGQIYLPADLLARHGSSAMELASGGLTPGLAAAIAELREIARRHAAAALKSTPQLAAKARPALLPLGLVEPYLKKMDRRGFDPFRDPVELLQWRRQWALWRFARKL